MKRAGMMVVILIAMLGSMIPAASLAKEGPQIYEAESGILTGTNVSTAKPGFSGAGYVTDFDNDGDSLAVTVKPAKAGLYQIKIRYNASKGHKQANLFVNGSSVGIVDFAPTNSFTEIPVTKAMLKAGANTIRIDKGWGWYDIDYFSIEQVTEPPVHRVSKTLVNPSATAEAKSLMSYLVDSYGHKILSGQQDYANVAWLQTHLGKKPAVVGFDLMDYSLSRVERGASTQEIEHAIDWDRQGGIVAFVWHWNAPKDLIDQPGKEWWRGFYTDSTTFDIEYALAHPKSKDYDLLLKDIDAIATQLKRLQEANIPVLFRPLHEAEGGWFWWGAKGAEPCKQLYRLIYNRLTNEHHLNNLIWVWNSISPDWYPGDDVVDIVSYDSYPPEGDYNPQVGKYDQLLFLVSGQKLIAMTENSAIPDPDMLITHHADWSWFSTWGGYDGKTNSLDHLKKVYNHAFVVTLDELPNLKKYKLR
ncbi:beta-mannanase [Paenibacillus sp. CAA11]|uniref:glycosyl hydrolase n=1 Tax=Paenibacillus sp. CAA11 TaxID=1532905 RepID=UPI000D339F1B|nr:glycosyl hydrolase [Paenibacillus sp. CAA11]AWB45536.1 beta-mannanase [Paenibacillus sp. CAA11]